MSPAKNGRTDRDAIWGSGSYRSMKPCIKDSDAYWHHLANTIKWSMLGVNMGCRYCYCSNNSHLTALCPGLPGWAGSWRNIHPLMWGHPRGDTCNHLCFMAQGEDNKGRLTDNLAVLHPIRTINAPTSIIPTIFMLEALPASALPVYPGLAQALSLLRCIRIGLVHYCSNCYIISASL